MAEAKCPLCGSELYLVRSYVLAVTGERRPCIDPDDAINDEWEVVCENDHRLDSGCRDMDGRSAVVGWRRAQVIGGSR